MDVKNAVFVFLLIFVGFVLYLGLNYVPQEETVIVDPTKKISSAPENAIYIIDGEQYHLFEGEFVQQSSIGEREVESVKLHSNPVYGDIDNDGDDDALVILSRENEFGTTSYYVALSHYEKGKFTGTDTIFLGNNVSVSTTTIQEGVGYVELLDFDESGNTGTSSSRVSTVRVNLNKGTGRIVMFETVVDEKNDSQELEKEN